jgi:hypothetical protein
MNPFDQGRLVAWLRDQIARGAFDSECMDAERRRAASELRIPLDDLDCLKFQAALHVARSRKGHR